MKFNFDTSFTKGTYTTSIVNNEAELPRHDAVYVNALIAHWIENVIRSQVIKATPEKESFEELVVNVAYLQQALDQIISWKSINCDSSNKNRIELQEKCNTLGNVYYNAIEWDNFSIPQQIVLSHLSNHPYTISSHELQEKYNPVNDDASDLIRMNEEITAFSYSQYGIAPAANQGLVSWASAYKEIQERITAFKALLKEAGDDLINWSQQKVSLRFTKIGIKSSYWQVSGYISQYNAHLEAKGVAKKEVVNKKDNLKKKIKESQANQDDLLKFFKQSSSIDKQTVLKMDLEHLYMIIDSDLKCITCKLYDKNGHPETDTHIIREALCMKSVTDQDYAKIIQWCTPSNVSLDFMIRHRKIASQEEIISFCERNSFTHIDTPAYQEFYDLCIKGIPTEIRYQLQDTLTKQYLSHMSIPEKVAFLKSICNKRVNLKVNYQDLKNSFTEVPYKEIRNTLLKDTFLLGAFAERIVFEKDHEAMLKCCLKTDYPLISFNKVFPSLTFSEKVTCILEDISGSLRSLQELCHFDVKFLTDKECLDILNRIINELRGRKYIEAIMLQLTRNSLPEANKIILKGNEIKAIPLNTKFIACLSTETKVALLKRGINLNDDIMYMRGGSHPITSDVLGKVYFSDLKREDLLQVYGNLYECPYIKFIVHALTNDERDAYAEQEISQWRNGVEDSVMYNSYFRYNYQHLSHNYLRKFKEKNMFKRVVGDCRNRANRHFGEALLKKLDVSNSIEFMFAA